MYSKSPVEKDLSTMLNDLEAKVNEAMTSVDKFQKEWVDIFYKDYEENDFQIFRSQQDLNYVIHDNWKERTDNNIKIQLIIKKIMGELNTAKTMTLLDKTVVEETNQEIQVFSKFVNRFELFRFSTHNMICISIESIQKNDVKRQEDELFEKVQQGQASSYFPARNLKYSPTKYCLDLARDLNDLSCSLIMMNTDLRYFDLSINEVIGKVQGDIIAINFNKPENAELQIENLVNIVEKVQSLLEVIDRVSSKYERKADLLVLQSYRRSLKF